MITGKTEISKLCDKQLDKYPELINDIMEYLLFVKNDDKNKNLSLVDIILDFSLKYDVDIDLVGDAISNDVYLKSFIEKDCEHHNVFKKETRNEEW